MGRLFGTDGVRGLANAELTPELALDLSVSAAHVLVEHDGAGRRPLAVVGRDTRASGELLEGAVVAGLASAGVDVLRAGVVPTPAVAYLTGAFGAGLGVVLSASHNPMPDNGIKFFDGNGFKLPDETEDEIERRLGERWNRPVGAAVGRVRDATDARDHYVGHLVGSIDGRLEGLRVVVDCAHGAAHEVAPDGLNINDGVGSTHPQVLQAAVREHRADVGIAHDGDADRCLAIDADGTLVDGDAILAICAIALRERGQLAGDTVVTTVMTNLGFKHAMAHHGIGVIETAVGDRYVLEAMREKGLVLGGEQSGHIVFLDHATTGDGVLTALQLLSRVAAAGQPLGELAAVMTRLPQVLHNVRVADKQAAMTDERVVRAMAEAERSLGDGGRLLVRPSGTEPVVRVMVEAPTEEQAAQAAAQVVDALAAAVR